RSRARTAGRAGGAGRRRAAAAASGRRHDVRGRLQADRRRPDTAPRLAIGRRDADRRDDVQNDQSEPGVQSRYVRGGAMKQDTSQKYEVRSTRARTSYFVLHTFLALSSAASAIAQARADSTLRVTVVDPSGAVIVGARVVVWLASGPPSGELETGPRGDATFTPLPPGRYTIHVESPGFEPADVRDYR